MQLDFLSDGTHQGRLLLSLATELQAKSLAEISVMDIVRSAHTSKRTFYEHFPDRDGCFIKLYAEMSKRVIGVMRAAASEAGEKVSFRSRVRHAYRAYLLEMLRYPKLAQRLYIDILSVGAVGLQLRRDVNAQFANIILCALQKKDWLSPETEVDRNAMLAAVAGINELILYGIEDGDVDELVGIAPAIEAVIEGTVRDIASRAGVKAR